MNRVARRLAGAWRSLVIVAAAYAPLLVAGRGMLNADTKLYLHTDPVDLMRRALLAWDPTQFGGHVPHQGVGYLWPSGPFFAVLDSIGFPAWFTQRLWLGTLLLFAALGVRALLAHLSFSRDAALLGGLAYMLSPYVLPYEARTSVMLLPWAGLGWLCLVAARGSRSTSWRWPALVGLIVFTVGAVNAAATLLVLPAPALVVLDAWSRGERRTSTVFALRSALTATATSLWWIAAVVLQGRHGADVLSYSETVDSVSSTANSFEVLRGFGYWLDYVGLDDVPLTTAALESLRSNLAIAVSLVLPAAALGALAFARRSVARLAAWMALVGVVLAVGVHPLADSAPLFRALAEHPDSTLALALRSSTRAFPVALVGFSVGVALVVDATWWSSITARLRNRAPSGPGLGAVAGTVLVATLVFATPARFTSGSVDANLSHSGVPDSWHEAAGELESATPHGTRFLQIPGQEFGAYTWGQTNDPALPAVTHRGVLTRDLLPLGNAQFMDSLIALDDAAREGRLDRASIDVLGRLLSFSAVFLPGDIALDRYATPSTDAVIAANGLEGAVTRVGGIHRAYVLPGSTGTLAHQAESTVLLAGDGKGLVDAAVAGLLESGAVRRVADIADEALGAAAASADSVVVTDTNAPYARHWRGTRDAIGFSEDVDGFFARLVRDAADVRLPVFAVDRPGDRTSFVQEGPVTARATSYGSPLSYQPEHRPFRAVDGDPSTAWIVGTGSYPRGERLELSATTVVDSVRLVQPVGLNRRISTVSISTDGGPWFTHDLDDDTTVVALDAPSSEIRIRIESVTEVVPSTAVPDGVGFAEVDLGLGATREVGVLPARGLSAAVDVPVSYVLTRLRAPIDDVARHDPETAFARRLVVPSSRRFVVMVRAHQDADSPASFDVLIDGRRVAVARGSGTRTWTSAPFVLSEGVHDVDTSAAPLLVDQVVLLDTNRRDGTTFVAAGGITDGSVHRVADVAACPEGCWFVFGEGHNTGWRASLDGVDLGEPVPIDGGANGWWLPAGTRAGTVVLDFAPQRTLTAGFVATALAVLACLVLALRRPRPEVDGDFPEPRAMTSRLAWSLVAGFVVTLVVAPAYGAVVAVVAWLLDAPRRGRLVRTASVALVVGSLARGFLAIVLREPALDFAWTRTAGSAHRLVLVGVCLVALATLLPRGDGRTGHSDAKATLH